MIPGQVQQSYEQYQHALQLTPDNAQVYANLEPLISTQATTSCKAMRGALKKSIELSPNYPLMPNLGIFTFSNSVMPNQQR